MTIKRDFELSDLRADQLVSKAEEIWHNTEGVVIDPDDTELTICTDNKVWARAWVEIGDVSNV
jgi:hypothetical protein